MLYFYKPFLKRPSYSENWYLLKIYRVPDSDQGIFIQSALRAAPSKLARSSSNIEISPVLELPDLAQ